MCSNDAKSPVAMHFAKQQLPDSPGTGTGSRRRRLWDLETQTHCTVVGVCFPLDTLRHLVNKAAGGKAPFDDYQVHVGAVAQCARRNVLSELMQGDLEKRFVLEIKAFRSAKTSDEVAALWEQAVQKGDVAGAYWAALTHPRCDAVLQEALCRDMHMLQHQAGASVRVDQARMRAVVDENAVLTRELARAQERCSRVIAEKCAEVDTLSRQVLRLQSEAVAKNTRIAHLTQELQQLQGSVLGVQDMQALLEKLDRMAERQVRLEAQNAALQAKLGTATRLMDALCAEVAAVQGSPLEEAPPASATEVPTHLHQKTVLCVGGRNGSIASYRRVIERVGGRFTHHDGGLEQSQNVLDASLEAADLVICQTGCISHNAYWKVKDFCKRTGKQCVFVESASASSLVKGLAQIKVSE